MNTLVLNPGSRWLKAAVYSGDGRPIDSQKIEIDDTEAQSAWFGKLSNVNRIGVRVVHGGNLESPQLFTKKVKQVIEEFCSFAPLHNPRALDVIELAQEQFKDVPVYCVFDTHFHRTLPEAAYTYPIAKEVADRYKIRRYGFHGIALESVLSQLIQRRKEEGKPSPKKLIMAHLGGGTSITAVEGGRSIATTMGVTPLEGAMMITRSGTVDPDVVRILSDKAGYSSRDVSKMLNEDSGFQGLLHSTDTKQIIDDAIVGKQPEALVFEIYVRTIVERIFSHFGLMQGADALVFSGGIGFRNEYIRPEVLKWTEIIGLDESNTYAFQADEARVIFETIRDL